MENLRGALLMMLAMACFASEDALIKALAGAWPSGQIILGLGLVGAAVFAVVCRLRGLPLWSRAYLHPAVLMRNLAEASGTFTFVTALTLIPLSLASAILQATPLLVTLGAALFLGEKVGWRRWSAIFVGLFGVLLILRPGFDAFEPAALFAVAGMVSLAARDIAVRRVPVQIASAQIAWLAFLTVSATGLLMLLLGNQALVAPTPRSSTFFLIAALFGAVGYALIVQATRTGDVSVVTPLRYTRLPFALLIGVVAFAERPDAATLTGATIVVASGLYTLAREARLNAAARP
ncbi:MAG: DMT family transporter [Pseudomonadota bacterium]